MSTATSNRPEVSEILERIDMPALLERYSGAGRKQGSRWLFRCPNPQHADNRPSFDVSYAKGKWWGSCRSEGVHVDAIDLLVWIGQAADRKEAIRILADMAGFGNGGSDLPPVTPKPPPQHRRDEGELDLNPARPDNPEAVMRTFLRLRGWGEQVVDLFGLEAVLDNRGRPRVRFPWKDHRGNILFYQDRAAWSDPAKAARWRSPAGVSAPFPFGMARLAELDDPAMWANEYERGDVFICEGPSDAVSLTDAFPDTVVIGVPGGNTPHKPWARALSGLHTFIVADADDQGDRYRIDWAEKLERHAECIYQVRVPPQWGDLDGWRKSVGDDFRQQFIDAVEAAIVEAGQ